MPAIGIKRPLCLAAGLLVLAAGARPVPAQDIFAGRGVYDAHCASCHGPDGTATVPGTPNFSEGKGLDFSDRELVRVIKLGRNVMPGYDRVLKETEIIDVISYIRTLRR